MNKIIVTSGQDFTDIDALAAAVSYAEFYRLNGKDAVAVLPGILNGSITEEIKSWNIPLEKEAAVLNASFVLVDISDPAQFAHIVNKDQITELFDHRYGHEKYWTEKLGNNTHIEMVGACATLIWEEFVKTGIGNKISQISANLLYTAIASNTLNFKAGVTTDRDKKAFDELKKHISLPGNWIEKYFEDQDSLKLNNIYDSIINDTKVMDGPVVGQLEMWNSKPLFEKHLQEIKSAMESFGKEEWFMSSPSISENKNYIYSLNENIKKLLEEKIGAKFNGDIGYTDKLMLRKEIGKIINN